MAHAREFNPSACLESIAAIEAEMDRLAHGLTEAQFHAPGPAGGWSIGFCLEHLVLSGQAILSKWDFALAHAARSPEQAARPPSYTLWQRAILNGLEPPYTLRTNARQSLTPTTRRPIEETLRRLASVHREVARRIDQSSGAAGRIRVQSPFVPWIRCPLGFSFDLALAHERRHVWQAWQVRRGYAR